MKPQQTTKISNWLQPDQIDASVTAWQVGAHADTHSEMRDRITLAFDCGPATIHLRPTAEEARELIKQITWALADGGQS